MKTDVLMVLGDECALWVKVIGKLAVEWHTQEMRVVSECWSRMM